MVAAGCADNNTSTPPVVVVRDASFIGYSDTASKQTMCGNCHIGMQARWANTKHASAWADLQASGHASASCNKCHTTNGATNGHLNAAGNPDTAAGYFAVATASKSLYQDVQCESCHGAGSVHALSPDSTQPLPSIQADTGLNTGCGTCHSGSHDPFVEEWRSTTHGVANSHAVGQASCAGCHNGSAALARFDPNANFTDKTSTQWVGVTCAVCHDPHGSSNPAQLTQPINTLDTTSNLCMRCHYRRSVPDQSSTRGPHAPQGPTLLGIAGWQPTGFSWSSAQQPTHANPTANPGLCAGCHVYGWSAKDTQTGKTVYTMGHRFAATPCTTPGGAPDTTSTCADSLKSFISCTQSGCHSSQAAARGALEAVEGRMQFYANVLWIDRNGNGAVDTTDGGLLAQVKKLKPGDWKTGDNLITAAEGAQFNVSLALFNGAGAHNPFYLEALMVATINAVQTTYGVAAPPAVQQYIATRQAAMRSRQ